MREQKNQTARHAACVDRLPRTRTCAFYWDFFRGTMAAPMNAFCNNRETARRALFLLGFLDNAEGR